MGANDKAAATYHPRTFECAWCGKGYTSQDAAASCCSEDWLGYD